MSSDNQGWTDLSSQQKKSGLAAWLGWMFDGLDMHIYTLVAVPFVAQLMHRDAADPSVAQHGAIINGAFLVGWALGGAFFGRIGDLLGRSRALCLTILTYAAFTGLSAVSTEWWHLMVFRFLSALGIGGEWAVGASLLSETWPRRWRPWIAATLQSAVNIGVLLACAAGWIMKGVPSRWIFLVGVLPALLVLWIRRAVPEPEEWHEARRNAANPPGIADLFRGPAKAVTWLVIAICGVSLTAHWTFMYWQQAYIRSLPEIATRDAAARNAAAVVALSLVMVGSIAGNYLAGALARRFGYRRAISSLCGVYGLVMLVAFWGPRAHGTALAFMFAIGLCQGVFALFTMCLPPLFPTLLRTTGAGFCYNIGRIIAAGGSVFFGIFTKVGDVRQALFFAGMLFFPAALVSAFLPEPRDTPGRTPHGA
ncbi:MAG: MFS transporter [Verrucomicrobia bacterium]|nr:MAG: MFS transporter [Verrucomicrobiota bacterium]